MSFSYGSNEGFSDFFHERGKYGDIDAWRCYAIENNEPEFHNETDRLIYNYIKENGFITAKQVITITAIKTQQGASVALNRLMTRGLIEKSGTGHLSHYILVEAK